MTSETTVSNVDGFFCLFFWVLLKHDLPFTFSLTSNHNVHVFCVKLLMWSCGVKNGHSLEVGVLGGRCYVMIFREANVIAVYIS